MKPLLVSKERNAYIGVFKKDELWASLDGKDGIVGMVQEDGEIYEYTIEKYNEMTYNHNDRYVCKLSNEIISLFFKGKESILDDSERKYLGDVIRPFRNKVKWVVKITSDFCKLECISIGIEGYNDDISLPFFEIGKMYKGMVSEKRYTLEELGL